MSIQPLRELAVTVREHDHGSFYWVLVERLPAGEWEELAISSRYKPNWFEAFDAGIVELHKHVPDELIGPREEAQSFQGSIET